jgi:hypothetical protein
MIRPRRAAAIFITTRNRKPATTSPSAKIGNNSAGVVAGEPVRALVSPLLDALATAVAWSESVRATLNAAVRSRELNIPTAGGSGTVGAGPVARAFVSNDVLACGGDADGVDDEALSSRALWSTGSSVVSVGAGCGLTASILICGKEVPMPPPGAMTGRQRQWPPWHGFFIPFAPINSAVLVAVSVVAA